MLTRLRPDAPERAAEAELTALHRQAQPDAGKPAGQGETGSAGGPRLELVPLNPVRGHTASAELGVAALSGSVALLVLVIAFANVANLFLRRALRRRHDVAIRLALGGGRAPLVAEQAIEGALLALIGAALAVSVALMGARRVQRLLFPDVAWDDAAVNLRVLLAVAGCAVLGGALAAALPMWQAGRRDTLHWLRAGGERVATTRGRGAMLLVQGALSVMLLVGAGLFVRSLGQAQGTDLGMDTDRLLVVSLVEGDAPLPAEFRTDLRRIVETLPEVERTTVAAGTLPFVSSWAVRLSVPGLPDRPRVDDGGPYVHAVEPGYFATAGTGSSRDGRSSPTIARGRRA